MNNLLQEQLDEVLTKSARGATLEYERALRIGAETLCRARVGEITATTIVCNIADDEIDAVESRVADIAEEYGLEASIRRQQPGSYSVRFTWPETYEPVQATTQTTAQKSLLARLLGR
jgi:hypothetical protein